MDPETTGCEQSARTAAALRPWPTGWPKRWIDRAARTVTRANGRRLGPGAPPSASRASAGPPPHPGKWQRCSAPRRATPKWRPHRLTAPARPPALTLRRARRLSLWQRQPLGPPPWGHATQPALPLPSVPPSWKLRQDGGAGDLSSAHRPPGNEAMWWRHHAAAARIRKCVFLRWACGVGGCVSSGAAVPGRGDGGHRGAAGEVPEAGSGILQGIKSPSASSGCRPAPAAPRAAATCRRLTAAPLRGRGGPSPHSPGAARRSPAWLRRAGLKGCCLCGSRWRGARRSPLCEERAHSGGLGMWVCRHGRSAVLPPAGWSNRGEARWPRLQSICGTSRWFCCAGEASWVVLSLGFPLRSQAWGFAVFLSASVLLYLQPKICSDWWIWMSGVVGVLAGVLQPLGSEAAWLRTCLIYPCSHPSAAV